jgi:hypothetical protein
MPCYEVRTISVEFKAGNVRLLQLAAAALGYETELNGSMLKIIGKYDSFSIDLAAGKASINENQQGTLNKLKQQYSKTVLQEVARKRRWLLKGAGNNLEMKRF